MEPKAVRVVYRFPAPLQIWSRAAKADRSTLVRRCGRIRVPREHKRLAIVFRKFVSYALWKRLGSAQFMTSTRKLPEHTHHDPALARCPL